MRPHDVVDDWFDARRQRHIFVKLAEHLLHLHPPEGITSNSHVLVKALVFLLLPEVVKGILESDLNDLFVQNCTGAKFRADLVAFSIGRNN
jgi:hypothetical protein